MTKTKMSLSSLALTRRRNAGRRKAAFTRRRRQTPDGRLNLDGASSPENIRRRLQWAAHEWQLPPPPHIGRTLTKEISDYVKAHGIDWEWYLVGGLQGLQRMMHKRKLAPAAAILREKVIQRFAQKYGQPTPEQRQQIEEIVRQRLAELEGEPA